MDKINLNGNYQINKAYNVSNTKGNAINKKLLEQKPDCFVSSKKVSFCGNKKEDKTLIINLAPLIMLMQEALKKKNDGDKPAEMPPVAEDFPDFYNALNEALENLEPEDNLEDFMNEITPYTPTMDIMGLIEEMKPALKKDLTEKYDNLIIKYIKENTPEDELESIGRQALADLIQKIVDNNEIHTMTLEELEQLEDEDEDK